MNLLLHFADRGMNESVREVADAVGLSKSTAHRLTQAFIDLGVLHEKDDHGQLTWGPVMVRIAHGVHRTFDVDSLVLPPMTDLRDRFDESVLLSRYDYERHDMAFTHMAECRHPLRAHEPIGVSLPVHAGATGKSILAHLPDDEQAEVLSRPLPAETSATITDPKVLRKQLTQIKAMGVAVSEGERTVDAVAIAAPVWSSPGRVYGSLGLTVPAYRFSDELRKLATPAVIQTADTISRLLGYGESSPPRRPTSA